MITESKTIEMLNHDEIPKDNTLIGAVAPPDGTPQPSTEVHKENGNRVRSDNEQPNPKDSEITSALSAVDSPTVNTIPCESRCDGIPPKLPKNGKKEMVGSILMANLFATSKFIPKNSEYIIQETERVSSLFNVI